MTAHSPHHTPLLLGGWGGVRFETSYYVDHLGSNSCDTLYLCFCDQEKLLKNHGDALVPQEAGHGPDVDGAHETLVQFHNARIGITERFGAVKHVDDRRSFGRVLAFRLVCKGHLATDEP